MIVDHSNIIFDSSYHPTPPPLSSSRLGKDANPQMDLNSITDIIHSTNYKYDCRPE